MKIQCPDNLLGITKPIHITLVGCGGTGSAVANMCFKLHTVLIKLGGKGLDLTCYDPKRVSEANRGRQAFWSSNDVGHYKANIVINRFNQFGGTEWSSVAEHYDGNGGNTDIIITTVDSAQARLDIGRKLKTNATRHKSQFWLDLGNSENSGQALLGSMSGYTSKNKLVSPLDLFEKSWVEATKNDEVIAQPSCSTEEAIKKQAFGVNDSLVANAFSMILFPLLRNGEIKNHGFIMDLNECSTHAIPVDENVWKMYGFNPKN